MTPPVLDAKVGDLMFPDWKQKFGWKAVGRRDDELAGSPRHDRLLSQPRGGAARLRGRVRRPPRRQSPGRQVTREGKTYHVAEAGERTIVTWTQQGHTCVIVAPSAVPQETLVDLAASRNV